MPISPTSPTSLATRTEAEPSATLAEGASILAPSVLPEGKAKLPPTDEAIKEANRRLALLQDYAALLAKHSKQAAADLLGESHVTLWRYQRAYAARGFEGLIPDTRSRGRKSVIAKLGVTPEIIQAVAGINLDTESNTAAWRMYARSNACPEPLADLILDPNRCSKHALPPSLRAATRINKAVANAHRGPRRLALKGAWTPRRIDILPGDIFSSDDTTPIWAWWTPWRTSDEYPFGVKLLQGQFLPVIDVASQCIITFVIIAREASSYRASDIWYLFGHTFSQIGLPRLGLQLERGSWEADLIRGEKIEYREGEHTFERRVGGLRQLPTNVTDWHRDKIGDSFPSTLQTFTSYLPKSKSIEGVFDRLQTLEGTLWGCLGRDQMRRPFEKAKKQFAACVRGKDDPREHFLSGLEMVRRLRGIMEYMNNERMEGEVFSGVPRQLFDAAVAERPLMRLPEDQEYLFRRAWKALPIQEGSARVRLTDPMTSQRYSLYYRLPAQQAAQLEGQRVVAYYDLEDYERPAQIHLARTGEFVCEGQFEDRVGMFLDNETSAHDVRKAWKQAVMSYYGTLAPHAPSRQLPPEIAARREAAKIAQAAEAAKVIAHTPATAALPAPEPSRDVANQFLDRSNRAKTQAAAAAEDPWQ